MLLDGGGLKPSRKGWRIHHGPGGTDGTSSRRVVDGPFAQATELIAGYTLIQVRSREEALEWSRRFPNPVRELYEMEDFTPGESLEKFKAIDAMSKP